MACNMWFSTTLVVLLYVVVASEEVRAAESSVSPTVSYWHRKLPTTPIPDALQQLIFPFSSHKTSEWLEAIRKGNKVSVGELGRKGGPDVDAVMTYPASYYTAVADVDDDMIRERNKVSVGELGRKGGPDVDAVLAYPIYYPAAADDDDMITDPAWSAMFFMEEEFHTGKKLTLYRKLLKKSTPDSGIFFLPRPLAETIPFSSDKLSVALDMLNISQGSHTALAMKNTLQLCEIPAIREIKYCTTSLESMIDQATSTLGTTGVSVLETNVPCNLNSQRYTITGIPFQSKSGSVICHGQPYPYAVNYCHQTQHTTVALVSLQGDDGSIGEAVTVCHADTSWWNPQFSVFKTLNVKPGGAPICHILPGEHVLWLPAN